MSDVKALVNRIHAELGGDIVITDPQQLQQAAQAISEHRPRSIKAIVRPDRGEQVQQLIKMLDSAGGILPVYPLSSGKNWGYGSKIRSQTALCCWTCRV